MSSPILSHCIETQSLTEPEIGWPENSQHRVSLPPNAAGKAQESPPGFMLVPRIRTQLPALV